MQLPAQQALFAGHFLGSRGLDDISFERPVVVSSLQILPANSPPAQQLLPGFAGRTQNAPFEFQVSPSHSYRSLPWGIANCRVHLALTDLLQGLQAR